MSTRRVYSETLPLAELVRPRTVALLARYELEVVLAVRPWDVPELPRVAATLGDAGVSLSLWPMLSDDEGRWASVHNARAFAKLALDACDALAKSGANVRDVLFDLEPPFAQTRSLAAAFEAGGARSGRSARLLGGFASGLSPAARRAFDAARDVLARAVSELEARGVATSSAVWPLVALDPPGQSAWQSALGTPVDRLGASHVSVMMYTSILEGWSRGALRRRHALALLAAATARAVARWGPAAGVSLGCVGTGALEGEPTYRDPSELADDVRTTRGAGCERLALFDLGGVLSRPPPEAWLEAFVHAESAPAPTSKRVEIARRIARAATWALGRVQA